MVDNSQLEPVTQVLDAYKAAVFAKDVDALVALYDQNVCVFDMWSKWSYDGLDAWRGAVTDWFGSLGSDRVAVEFEEVQTIMAQEVAIVHAFVIYKGVSAEGEALALRAMTNRLTWALGQKGGDWKIVHEHTSAPVNFKTAKVTTIRL